MRSYEVVVDSEPVHQFLGYLVSLHTSHHLLPLPDRPVQPLHDVVIGGVGESGLADVLTPRLPHSVKLLERLDVSGETVLYHELGVVF